jgi:hypothetical protein
MDMPWLIVLVLRYGPLDVIDIQFRLVWCCIHGAFPVVCGLFLGEVADTDLMPDLEHNSQDD